MKALTIRAFHSVVCLSTLLLIALTTQLTGAQQKPTALPEALFPDAVSALERDTAYAALQTAALPESSSSFAGQSLTVAVLGQGPRGSISGPIYFWKPAFEAATGAALTIVELPFATLEAAVEADFRATAPTFDVIVAPAWASGAWMVQGRLQPVDSWLADDRYPTWPPEYIVPPISRLLYSNNQLYGTPFDADAHVLYYRRDILSDPDFQAQFASEVGYPLPNPPTTWQQVLAVTHFFNGKDWNRDGDGDDGISLSLKSGGQSFFHYLSISAPFEITSASTPYWFDATDMTPRINSPGHVAALDFYRDLAAAGQPLQSSWTLTEAWDNFLVGNAVATFAWGDLGPLAQKPENASVTGRLGVTSVNCSDTWADPSGTLVVDTESPNCASSLNGASWFPVMAATTSTPELAYYFMAMHANPAIHAWNVASGWTGIEPVYRGELPPTQEVMSLDYLTQFGFNANDAEHWLSAYSAAQLNPYPHQAYLRIPGTPRYWSILDTYLVEAITGRHTAQQSLDLTAQAWDILTNEIGRDSQLAAYITTINQDE